MGEMGAILKPTAAPPFRVSDMIFEQPPIMFPHLAHADLKKSNTAPTHLHKIRRKNKCTEELVFILNLLKCCCRTQISTISVDKINMLNKME